MSDSHDRLLIREFLASALYLDLVLFAGLVAYPSGELPPDDEVVLVLVGSAVGLLAAHWFAFRMAAHVTSVEGSWDHLQRMEALAQFLGGVSAATLAALPFLLFNEGTARNASLWVLGSLPAVVGFTIGRVRGRSWPASLTFAVVALGLACGVVLLKVYLH